MAYIQCSLSAIAVSWFLRLPENYKKIGLPVYLLSHKFLQNYLHITHKLKLRLSRKKKQKTYVCTYLEINNFLKNAGAMNLLQPLTSNVMKVSLRD